MSKLWVCPYCKWENYSGRVGMMEPQCIRCGKRRTTKDDILKDLKESLNEWETEVRESRQKLENVYGRICSLEDEMSELNLERIDLETERDEAQAEVKKIRESIDRVQDMSGTIKYVSEDQCTFSKWVDVIGEDGAE